MVARKGGPRHVYGPWLLLGSLSHVASFDHWLEVSLPCASPGALLTWMHFPILAADAHRAHHDSWPSTAHQASSCHDSRSLWFPFLALGISASPYATHMLQANQSWEGSSVKLSIEWTHTPSFLIHWSHSMLLWDKSFRTADIYRC